MGYILVSVANREIETFRYGTGREVRRAMFKEMLATKYVDVDDLFDIDGLMRRKNKAAGHMTRGNYGANYRFDENSARIDAPDTDMDWAYFEIPEGCGHALVELEGRQVDVFWYPTYTSARRGMLERMADTKYVDYSDLFEENGTMKEESPGYHLIKGNAGAEYMFCGPMAYINKSHGGYDWLIASP